jgi:anaerobic magnesium-protoporphyrin IX monomethyl ester cyclase
VRVTLCYPSLLPGNKSKYGLQPLGVLYIAALLKREGFDVTVLDADVDGLTVDETVERVLAGKPDLVGLSLMTPQLMTALAISAKLKQQNPELPIVLGGAHMDSTKGDTFSMADCFDIAVHGEGEFTLAEICHNVQKHGASDVAKICDGVPGAIFRDALGQIVENPPRVFLKELDELPSVDYDMIDHDKYSIPTMAGSHVLSMMLSRGCPFACTFCDAPITMGKKLRFWSIDRVIEDIRFYKEKYGVTNFVFKDSTFTAHKKWAAKFLQALIDADLDIKFRCNTRVNLVPGPLLELMAKAGCYVINFGVESGDPEVLKKIKKQAKLEEVADAFERCRKLGIRTYATFLIGNPGESVESIRATIDFSKKIRPSLCMFFVSTAYPGTDMYNDAVADGQIEPRWWANQGFDSSKNSAFQVRWGWTDAGALKFSEFDSEYWQRKATREWYFRPQFIFDTLSFTLKNPYFIRHLWNLGIEMIPFYKLRNLLPGKTISAQEKLELMEQCPSEPEKRYLARENVSGEGLH